MTKRFLITGGAGFIGSAVVRHLIRETDHRVCVVDKLTYAGNLASLAPVANNPRYSFVRADIADADKMKSVFASYRPDVVMHLAAESHVDRSIDGPAAFMQTNIIGTYVLLEAALAHWRALPKSAQSDFRFHHISTDEVFGSLDADGSFTEETAYDPRSPYSASKAASDHLVRSWHHTYGLPVLVTNCSNNYGPYHFPEKLVPLTIINGLEGMKLPVYGTGGNVRDWLYVEDHARALLAVVSAGQVGETYCIGGRSERTNLDVVKAICALLDELRPARRSDAAKRSSPSSPIVPATIFATPSIRRGSAPSLAGSRARPSSPDCARRWNGIWPIARGGSRSARASMAASAWGFRRDPRVRRQRPARPGADASGRRARRSRCMRCPMPRPILPTAPRWRRRWRAGSRSCW